MKKIISLLLSILFCASVLTSCEFNAQKEKSKFYWIPEESHFVDYEIIEDKIVFSYSICFVNDYDEDFGANVSARFKKSELKNWVEYEKFYLGNSTDNVIKGHSKKNVIYHFEGKYLGGTVNTNLSFPLELIMSTYFPHELT